MACDGSRLPNDTLRVEVHGERVPISPFDAKLLDHLRRHISDEDEVMHGYRNLAASDDAAVRYVAELILEDEARHHRILVEIMNNIVAGATLVERHPRVPWLARANDPRALRQAVRRLKKLERRDLRRLRLFKRRLGPLRDTTLHGMLATSLVMDTRKHLVYLTTLERLAARNSAVAAACDV